MTDSNNPRTGKVDGRHRRVEEGKSAVYQALVEHFDEGGQFPTIAQIAARAGISERTVFRYFESFDDLIAGMVGHLYPRVAPYFEAKPPAGDLFERLLALAELRIEYTERHSAVWRTTEALALQWPAAAMARYGRVELLNAQLKEWIGPDLPRVSDAKLVVLAVLFDVPNIESIRVALGTTAAATLARAAMAVIGND